MANGGFSQTGFAIIVAVSIAFAGCSGTASVFHFDDAGYHAQQAAPTPVAEPCEGVKLYSKLVSVQPVKTVVRSFQASDWALSYRAVALRRV